VQQQQQQQQQYAQPPASSGPRTLEQLPEPLPLSPEAERARKSQVGGGGIRLRGASVLMRALCLAH
jgi:hypothetical protein